MLVHLEQIVLFCLKSLKTSMTTYHYNIWDILHLQTHDAMQRMRENIKLKQLGTNELKPSK